MRCIRELFEFITRYYHLEGLVHNIRDRSNKANSLTRAAKGMPTLWYNGVCNVPYSIGSADWKATFVRKVRKENQRDEKGGIGFRLMRPPLTPSTPAANANSRIGLYSSRHCTSTTDLPKRTVLSSKTNQCQHAQYNIDFKAACSYQCSSFDIQV